jgi:hypothetical protein
MVIKKLYVGEPRTSLIGYIVMPPGHGKTYHHGSIQELYEADQICDCRGDETLAMLREEARRVGYWGYYDEEWSSRISRRLKNTPCVIMVPAVSIGERIGGTHLGTAQLRDKQWQENINLRGKTVSDYEYARQVGSEVINFDTNEQLSSWLRETAYQWVLRP